MNSMWVPVQTASLRAANLPGPIIWLRVISSVPARAKPCPCSCEWWEHPPETEVHEEHLGREVIPKEERIRLVLGYSVVSGPWIRP